MEMRITKEALGAALASVHGAADARGTVPILGTVLIKTVDDGKVSVLCSDAGMVARSLAPCTVGRAGEIAVDVRRLYALAKAVPDKSDISVAVDGTVLRVSAGRSRFRLDALSATEYPRITPAQDRRVAISMDSKRLAAMLDQVLDAAAVNDTRIALNGVLFAIQDRGFWMVGTDGCRMHAAVEPLPDLDQEPVSAIIPRRTALQARRLLGHGGMVTLTLGGKDCQLSCPDGSVLFGNAIDARFPDWTRIVPAKGAPLVVDTGKFQAALNMLMAVPVSTDTKTAHLAQHVGLALDGESVVLTRSDTGRCELDARLPAGAPSVPFSVGVNVDFLATALKSIGSDAEAVELEYGAAHSPLVIRPAGKDYPLAIVMPIRE